MNPSRIISTATTCLVLAASLAPLALAGGEPKNESPFTTPASAARTLSVAPPHKSNVIAGIRGEPKNQEPFTKLAGGSAREPAQPGLASDAAMRATAGQAKEQAAITSVSRSANRISSPAVIVVTSNGFHWGDLAIGSAAALAALLATSGALVLLRNLRVHKPGAAQ